MQSTNYIGKGRQGNSAMDSGEEKTEARLLWEIGQHKRLEERVYYVLEFFGAVCADAATDSDLTLNADARQGLRYLLQDLQGRVSSACFGYYDWRGDFYKDDLYGAAEKYEPEKA